MKVPREQREELRQAHNVAWHGKGVREIAAAHNQLSKAINDLLPALLDDIEEAERELAAEREKNEGWSESCERYIRNAHEWRDRAERAEAACAAKDEALLLFTRASLFGSSPSRGETWIGWQADDGPSADERQSIAQRALSTDAGRAYAERMKRYREALEAADQFITNGIELGYIRMPDADVPDPAKETPRIIREALQEDRHV